ncbi:MAG: formate dehydrogenase accessory sulfurtransferase FdhD, partial [Candidatus Aerophobetes bacterium]|nr:formate dehydrogenase accessory sulfurtransferase FdhD [Candidatus Aerophobetes bacterium]
MKLTKKLFITQIEGKRIKEKEDVLVTEEKFILYLNGKEILSSSCTPANYKELLYGFLFSEGIIRKPTDISSIKSEDNK